MLYAFEQDQLIKRYQTFDQLLGYCRYSANPVGHLVLYLCRVVSTRERAALADHVCTGLQLANFWQDVARDLAIGRVYLPAEDRRRFGYADADLRARRFNPGVCRPDALRGGPHARPVSRGLPLVERVPAEVRGGHRAVHPGRSGDPAQDRALRYNVWQARPVLSRWQKAALLTGALWRRVWSRPLW